MALEHSTARFTSLTDLASARVGGRALAASDEFFAPKSNLVKPEPPIFVPGKFTPRGKWMDGWESRRRRTPGHDWCVIVLGMRGVVHGVNVETTHFTGNSPSHGSIDALDAASTLRPAQYGVEGSPWTELLPKSPLRGNGDNLFVIDNGRPWTHLRLNIFPDGGVARLRVYGEVAVDWPQLARGGRIVDLAFVRHGGLVLGASDMHFGSGDNLIMPGRAKNMGDGWETRRRRGAGHDWAVVRLGRPGVVSKIEIDTNHFIGNYPESASLEGCLAPAGLARPSTLLGTTPSVSPLDFARGDPEPVEGSRGRSGRDALDALASMPWTDILPRTKLGPNRRHVFSKELRSGGPVSHVRLNIFPDGGVSRLRVYGTVAAR